MRLSTSERFSTMPPVRAQAGSAQAGSMSSLLLLPLHARTAAVRVAAILACAVLSTGCRHDATPGTTATAATEPVLLVDVATAATRDLDVTIDAVGTAYASGQVDIRPQISGTLLEAPFTEGQRAEAGQVLARFDDSKARASLALAEAQLDSSRAKLAVANERLARSRRLAAEQLVSREEFATVESEQKAAAASVREQEAEVRLAARNLEDYTLRAPISGRMGIRRVDTGNYVEAGTIISTLVETDPIEVLFTVPGALVQGLEVGQEAEIRDTDAARSLLARGKVRVIDPRVDIETRMVSVKALVPNSDEKIKANQFVSVSLVRERRASAVVVPEVAVIPHGGKTFVFVLDGDRATRREVELGMRLPESVEIRSGLKAGDQIVTRGQHRLADGAKVDVHHASDAVAPSPADAKRAG
jgi:RND family efflux transporter MFP subunit